MLSGEFVDWVKIFLWFLSLIRTPTFVWLSSRNQIIKV